MTVGDCNENGERGEIDNKWMEKFGYDNVSYFNLKLWGVLVDQPDKTWKYSGLLTVFIQIEWSAIYCMIPDIESKKIHFQLVPRWMVSVYDSKPSLSLFWVHLNLLLFDKSTFFHRIFCFFTIFMTKIHNWRHLRFVFCQFKFDSFCSEGPR